MTPSISSTRELAIASRKRLSSGFMSEEESDGTASGSPSEFETPNKPLRRPVKKRARTIKTPTPAVSHELTPKIAKIYESNEEHTLFSAKWFKEVTKRDEFWDDFKKKVPKAVLLKRFKIDILVDINGEKVVTEPKSTSVAGKVKSGPISRKPAGKIDSTTLTANASGGKMATATFVSDEKNEGQSNGDDVVVPKETTTGTLPEAEVTEEGVPQEKDDLLSVAIANPNTTEEERQNFKSIQEDQERIEKVIAWEVEEKRKKEFAQQKRIAAKERKAARDAVVEAVAEPTEVQLEEQEALEAVGAVEAGPETDGEGDTEVQQEVVENGTEGNKDEIVEAKDRKPRKEFNPTRF